MPPPRVRQVWIDLFRGLAVTGMIWTHSANTFLDSAIQQTAGYANLSFYHGLVAPTFFWVAGFMRGMAASRDSQGKSLRPTVLRLLMIWAMGYLFHVPWGALRTGNFISDDIRLLCQCDVLQCLAISCLILVAVEAIVKGLQMRRAAVLLLGALAVLATPWLSQVTTGLPWFDAYLGKQHGSLFPLFPWFGFAAAGFLFGSPWTPSWKLGLAAVTMAFGVPFFLGNNSVLLFFLERLGWVISLALIVSRLPASHAMFKWLRLAGRESLLVYGAHLVMIYALPWWGGRTMDKGIGPTQPMLPVAGLFVGLLALSLLLAKSNEWRKARQAEAR